MLPPLLSAQHLRSGWFFTGPGWAIVSNAVFQNQIVAVLLHRIDEELLCGNLHRNTSLYHVGGCFRRISFSLKSPAALRRLPQGVGIIAPGFGGKKCQN